MKNVSDLNGFKNVVAQQYAVTELPTNYLVDPQGKIIANQKTALFTTKTKFFTMACHSEKKPTSSIYHIKLVFRIIYYAKIEFSTENVFFVFANLGNIFGETWRRY